MCGTFRISLATLIVLTLVGCQDEALDARPDRIDTEALADSIELGYSMLNQAYYQADSLPPGIGVMFRSMEQMHTEMLRQRRRIASGMGHGMMGGGGMRGRGGQGMHRRMHSADSASQMREWHQQMMGTHAQMADLAEREGRGDLVAHHREMERRHGRMMGAMGSGGGQAASPVADTVASPEEVAKLDGRTLYGFNCAVCHGSSGQGLGTFPPLAGSSWVRGDEETLARIVLYGLQGPIDVGGQRYNGLMPAFGSRLSDGEVAALLSYLRSSWGNESDAVEVDDIRVVRRESRGRSQPWTAAELRSEDDGG